MLSALILLIAQVTIFPLTGLGDTVELRSGQSTVLQIDTSEPADQLNVYRKTGVTTSASLVSTLPVLPGVYKYEWVFVMPGGSTAQYRLFVVPKKDGELLGASNDVRVRRVR